MQPLAARFMQSGLSGAAKREGCGAVQFLHPEAAKKLVAI